MRTARGTNSLHCRRRNLAHYRELRFSVLIDIILGPGLGLGRVIGAAEPFLPSEDYDISDDSELDFLAHSQSFGRLSAVAMLVYFCIGPYVNMTLFNNPPLASFFFPVAGMVLMLLTALQPKWFKGLSIVFTAYTLLILFLTA